MHLPGQRTQLLSIIETNWLETFGKITGVYCEITKELIITLGCKMKWYLCLSFGLGGLYLLAAVDQYTTVILDNHTL